MVFIAVHPRRTTICRKEQSVFSSSILNESPYEISVDKTNGMEITLDDWEKKK